MTPPDSSASVLAVIPFLLALSGSSSLNAQDWVQTAGGPPQRQLPRLAFDAARAQTLLFGGYSRSSASSVNDTWTFDGATWTPAAPAASPSKRDSHGMSFDVARSVVTLFGGVDTANFPASISGETWKWNGITWTQRVPAVSPAARFGCAMAYDQGRGVHVLFSGSSATAALADTWEWNGTTWTQKTTATTPPARTNHALVYDLRRGRIVLFGGAQGSTPLGDTWEYDGTNWSQVTVTPSPPARRGHGFAYDLSRGVAIVVAGLGAGTVLLGDTWEYDGSYWYRYRAATIPGGSARTNTALAYDIVRRRVVLFGGAGNSADLGDTWEHVPSRASLALYGASCAGSTGTPALDGSSLPTLGGSLQLTVGPVPTSAPTALLLGPTPTASFPIPGTSCSLRILSPLVDLTTSATGTAAGFTLAIPNNPALGGLTLLLQAAALDPAANALGVIATNGARAVWTSTMRTSTLIVTLLLLGATSADLARRLSSMSSSGPFFVMQAPTRSAVIAAQGSHDSSFELESQDGTTSVVLVTITPGPSTKIAEVVIEHAKLDHRAPQEPLPHRVKPEGPDAIKIRLHFRDVQWKPATWGQGYEAYLEHRVSVLYTGCDLVDVKTGSASYPFRVEKGPAFEEIRRQLGSK